MEPQSPFDNLLLDVEEDDEDDDEEEEEALLPQGRGIPAGGPIAVWLQFPDVWPCGPASWLEG